jgi:anti-sigma factor RsiW
MTEYTADPTMHLTEEERQTFADGSMPDARRREVGEHLRDCASCAADVERLRRLMTRTREAPPPTPSASLDELWPGIRARIEERKVVTLPTRTPARGARPNGGGRLRWAVGLAAAALLTISLSLALRQRATQTAAGVAAGDRVIRTDSALALTAAVDSARSYQEEAQVLLDRLELQRAMLGPEASAAIDRDLAVVDSAIAELQSAIRHDPNDLRLRQLLAMSYKRKVDVLKRVGNAG